MVKYTAMCWCIVLVLFGAWILPNISTQGRSARSTTSLPYPMWEKNPADNWTIDTESIWQASSTPSLTPTFHPGYSHLRIYKVGPLPGYRYLITLQGERNFVVSYRGKVETKEFHCQPNKDYPDRLYCSGPALPEGKEVTFTLYSKDGDRLYWTSFRVPQSPTATAIPVAKRLKVPVYRLFKPHPQPTPYRWTPMPTPR